MDRRPEPPLKPAFDPERLHTSFVPAFPGGNETPGVAPAITDTDLDRISRPDAYYDKAVKNVPMIHTNDAGTNLHGNTPILAPIERSEHKQPGIFVAPQATYPAPAIAQAGPSITPSTHSLISADKPRVGSDGLERSMSVSSMSSLNSTSSIEAAPFRAPPLGNIRTTQPAAGPLANPVPQVVAAPGTTVSPHPPLYAPSGRHRLPKPLSDDWVFRNGPGMNPTRPGSWETSPRLSTLSVADIGSIDARFRGNPYGPSGDSSDESNEDTHGVHTPEMAVHHAPPIVRRYTPRPPSRASSRASYRSRSSVMTVNGRPSSLDTGDTKRDSSINTSAMSPGMRSSVRTEDLPIFEALPAAEHASSSDTLTPAQLVRLEARAGIARAPGSPGTPQPGALSSPTAEDNSSLRPSTSASRQSDLSGYTPTLVPASSTTDLQSLRGSTPIQTLSPPSYEVPSRGYTPHPRPPTTSPLAEVPPREPPRGKRTPRDFIFGEVLGEGSYSTVLKAWDIRDCPGIENSPRPSALQAVAGQTSSDIGAEKQAYAIKMLDKVHILREKKQKYVGIEKEALSLLVHRPGIITLYWTFQDRESLYFVLELAPRGELLQYIQQYGSLDMESATHYAAQLADAIDGIHSVGVIHRDIKPENVLLGEDMRIRITDFGSARIVHNSPVEAPGNERASSFVGTADYVSPELLGEKMAGPPSDWWAFGCVVFQMLVGKAPFKATNEYQTFQRIIRRSFEYPPELPQLAREFIDPLLALDPMERPTASRIKGHPFFAGVNFTTLWSDVPPRMSQGLFAPARTSNISFTRGLQELESTFDQISVPLAGESVQSDSQNSFSSSYRDTEVSTSGGGDSSDEERSGLRGQGIYSGILQQGEMLLYSSPIKLKKTGPTRMFSKRCRLLLTSFPRVLCVSDSQALRLYSDVRLIPPSDLPEDRMGSPSSTTNSTGRLKSPALQFQPIQAFSRGLWRMNNQIAQAASASSTLLTGEDSSHEPHEQESSDGPMTTWLVQAETRSRREFVLSTVSSMLTSPRVSSFMRTHLVTLHSGFSAFLIPENSACLHN